MNRPFDLRPIARVPLAVAVSGGLGVLMAAGLHLLGVAERMDRALAAGLGCGLGMETADFPKALSGWLFWPALALVSFGLAAALLNVPGCWRRLVLWSSALLLTLSWAPVLALAAHQPQVGAACAAVLWVGVCTVFYCRTHIIPCDPQKTPRKRRATT